MVPSKPSLGQPPGDFRLGEWVVQPRLNRLSRSEKTVQLEPKLMDVLVFLAEHPRQVVSKDEIMDAVWARQFIAESVLTRAIAELRRLLGDDARDPRYIETIHRRGYRLIAAVALLAEPAREDASAEPGTTARRSARVRWLLLSAAIVVLGAAAAAILFFFAATHRKPPGIGASGRPAIAVMEFEDHTGAEEIGWLSRGLPSMLLTGLAQTEGLDVIGAERIREVLKQLGQEEAERLDRSLVPETARRAGAGAVVVGSIFRSGAGLRIDVQVEDVASGRLLSAFRVEGDEVFSLADQLAREIRASLDLGDAPAGRRIAEVTTSSLEAYRLYCEGREASRNMRHADAARLLRQAVELDPSFAMAYFELWRTDRTLGWSQRTPEYRRRLLDNLDRLTDRQSLVVQASLARSDGEPAAAAALLEEVLARYPDEELPYNLLATIQTHDFHQTEKALATYERGIRAVPRSGLLHNFYGYRLFQAARYEEALRQLEIYAEICPREPNPYDSQAELYLVMGQPERALEKYARALDVDPTFRASHEGSAWAYAMLGRFGEALAEAAECDAASRTCHFLRALLLSRVGRMREAEEQILGGLRQALARGSPQRYVASFHLLDAVLALERGDFTYLHESAGRAAELSSGLPAEEDSEGSERWYPQLAYLLAGTAEARSGNLEAARSHLASLESLLLSPLRQWERWWNGALEGEIALAAGDPDAAEASFSAGEPDEKMYFELGHLRETVFANNLPLRDGLARVAAARGDLAKAIEIYRRLNTPDIASKFTAVLEPKYVLELARLLEESGDGAAAREQYERFLELWEHADPGLPEVEEARSYLVRRQRR